MLLWMYHAAIYYEVAAHKRRPRQRHHGQQRTFLLAARVVATVSVLAPAKLFNWVAAAFRRSIFLAVNAHSVPTAPRRATARRSI